MHLHDAGRENCEKIATREIKAPSIWSKVCCVRCASNLSRHDYLFLMQGEGSGILLLPSLSVHVFTFRRGYYYYYYVTISVLRQGLLQLQAGVSAN